MHAIGPHEPYDPPAPYNTMYRSELASETDEARERTNWVNLAVNLYDGEIAFTDAQFGRLIEEPKRLDLYDETLIVFLSDHGEEFWEHGGRGHGSTLYDEQIRIPCIVKLPHSAHAGSQYEGIAEIIDIAPTILEYLKIAAPESYQGQSLKRALSNAGPLDATAYSSLFLSTYALEATRNLQSKYVHDLASGSKTWFDLIADSAEQRPLTMPPASGDTLERYAERINATGESGLHILITGSLSERHTIS